VMCRPIPANAAFASAGNVSFRPRVQNLLAASSPRPLERIGQEGVICYAQKQTDHGPNENATD
jgi:hypothetical protein